MERLGTRVSEKVIRRLMKEMRLTVKQPRRARYSSYKGEITPAADNLIACDFKASRPNEKWLTDITEFWLSDGKVYLSPMIDCFDGMPVIPILNDYLIWYREKCIKLSLHGLSPVEYRRKLGLI